MSFIVVCSNAFAFTTHPEGDNGTALFAGDDLQQANRWSLTMGSLVEDGVRGLGGGIEYSVSADFCEEMADHFAAIPRPTCGEIRGAIQRAFDVWAEGHPYLRFVDVSDSIKPVIDSAEGAEIDIFARRPIEYPNIKPFGALTLWWWNDQPPIGTNGRELSGHSLSGADIIFSRGDLICYHMRPSFPLGQCNHFQSLVLHEIGHALGLYHPNEMAFRNFDSDINPENDIEIDCDDPATGLFVSNHIDPSAVMNAEEHRGTPVYAGLRPDDLGGRNFLYPICDLASRSVVSAASATSDLAFGSELLIVMLAMALIWRRTRRGMQHKQYVDLQPKALTREIVQPGAGNGI